MPLGTSGRVWSVCLVSWCSDDLFCCSWKGPQPRGRFASRDSHSFFYIFICAFFQTSFLTAINPKTSQNGNSQTAKTHKKLQKLSPKRTHSQDLQKDSVWQRPNLWNWQPLQHFQLFSQRPRALKVEPKRKPKLGLWAPKIIKNLKHEHLKKH